MAGNLGTIYVGIKAPTDKLKRDLNKAKDIAQRSAKSISNAFSKINIRAIGVAGAAAFGAVAIAGKKAIDAASNLQEVQGKFDVVFGANKKAAESWSKVLVQSYAMSTREAKQHLSAMQDLLEPLGMNADAAAKLSNEIVKFAADLGSFNNLPTADVLRDIRSAMVGNYETVRKYGANLSAARIEQIAFNKRLIKNKKELTGVQKAQIAWTLILENNKKAVGDMIRTQNNYANQIKRMKATIEDVAAVFGAEFIPLASEAVKDFSNLLLRNKDRIVGWAKFILGQIRSLWNFWSKFFTDIRDGFTGTKQGVKLFWNDIKAITAKGVAYVKKLFGVKNAVVKLSFKKTLNFLKKLFADWIGVVAKGIGKIEESTGKNTGLRTEMIRYRIELYKSTQDTETYAEVIDAVNEKYDAQIKEIDEKVRAQRREILGLNDLTDAWQKLVKPQQDSTSTIEGNVKAVKDLTDAWQKLEDHRQEMSGKKGFFVGLNKGWEEAIEHVKDYETAITELGSVSAKKFHEGLSDSLFKSLLGEFEDLTDAWRNMWDHMWKDMLKVATDYAAKIAGEDVIGGASSIGQALSGILKPGGGLDTGALSKGGDQLASGLTKMYGMSMVAQAIGNVQKDQKGKALWQGISGVGSLAAGSATAGLGGLAFAGFTSLMGRYGGEAGMDMLVKGLTGERMWGGKGTKDPRRIDMRGYATLDPKHLGGFYLQSGKGFGDPIQVDLPPHLRRDVDRNLHKGLQGIAEEYTNILANLPKALRAKITPSMSRMKFFSRTANVEEAITEFGRDIQRRYEKALTTALHQLGYSVAATGSENVEYRLRQYMEDVKTFNRQLQQSGELFVNSFVAAFESGTMENFEEILRNSVYESIKEGMIAAFMESKYIQQFLQPFFETVEGAFETAMGPTGFNAAAFNQALTPAILKLNTMMPELKAAATNMAWWLDYIQERVLTGTVDESDLPESTTTTVTPESTSESTTTNIDVDVTINADVVTTEDAATYIKKVIDDANAMAVGIPITYDDLSQSGYTQ